ncbi:unnamed protein product [Caenorhabditis auriculariae]|uniref:G-protein coupled receptors family 1 profile domain-containing protein n=1 Tax=Caenorhabditis auriculariae TaxID=2777116 RepID=A0A8S1H252_9PELO|nr:unnamed protein product [Caenorhabditis auriculariae]
MNVTEATDNFPTDYIPITPIRLAANAVWSITAALGIPANVFVLASIVYFRDMRTISNVYIFNLALADLLFLSGIPIVIIQHGDWDFGATICKLYVSQFASPVFIAILSFDRFMAVCRPLASTAWRSTHAAFAFSLLAWAMVILEMTPLLLFAKVVKISNGGTSSIRKCMLFVGSEKDIEYSDDSNEAEVSAKQNVVEDTMLLSKRFFTAYIFTFSYLLPLLAVWYFYVKIITRMCRRRQQMYIKRTITKKKTTKVTIMGLAIVTSYTLCWLPFWLVQWSIETNASWKSNQFLLVCVSYFAFSLQYVNSAANPFLYVFLSDSFKRNVSKLLQNRGVGVKNMQKRPSATASDTTKMLSVQTPNSGACQSF